MISSMVKSMVRGLGYFLVFGVTSMQWKQLGSECTEIRVYEFNFAIELGAGMGAFVEC